MIHFEALFLVAACLTVWWGKKCDDQVRKTIAVLDMSIKNYLEKRIDRK